MGQPNFFFEIGPLVLEKMSFKSFSVFSYGSHVVQWGGTILAMLVDGHPRNFCGIILKSGHRPRKRWFLKVFLFLALAAILFCGSVRIISIFVEGLQGTFL